MKKTGTTVLAISPDGKFKIVQYKNGDLRVILLGARYTIELARFDDAGGNIMLRHDTRKNGR